LPFRSAFFAYPNEPSDLAGTIAAAAEAVKTNLEVKVTAWPQLPIFGAVIPDEVRTGIENSDVLICDVTRPNLNVYYEIGYGIGLGKSLAPVMNSSFAGATSDIQRDGLFDVIGYKAYENSETLSAIITDLPAAVLVDLYGRPLNTSQPVYFLSGYRKTDYVNTIARAIKDSKVFFRTFDPAEIARFSIVQAIVDVTASSGIIVPFLEDHVDDAPRHNIRAAFLAGLGDGLGRDVLLLRHRVSGTPGPSAADFRDNVQSVKSEAEIIEKVTAFCAKTLVSMQSIRKPSARTRATGLQRLTLGAIAAENEFRTLDEYFLETSEFLKAERGEVGIVAGRKGSGKTAIFFMVRDSFRRQKNAIIADLRPESHQLSLFKDNLSKLLAIGLFDHTIASFWYFVILTELLVALKKEIDFQAVRKPDLLAEVFEIEKELTALGVQEAGDFTARINRLTSFILTEIDARVKRKEYLTTEQLTNIVFRGGAATAKRLVVKHSAKAEHLVFLFDNIDKGWASDGVDELDVKLVRLLLEALEKVRSDLTVDHRDLVFVVFLRNDVFELMVAETPDRGKSAIVRIDWTDRIKLKQLIHLRLRASLVEGGNPTFNDIWGRYFTSMVRGRDTFEFFVDHCLMRPRFLIAIIENAIANAINRGHEKVEVEDCDDAVRQHSNAILNDFGYEIRDVSGVAETVLYSLVGTTDLVTKGEVLERFARGGVTTDHEKLFTYLLWYGVLGVVNAKNEISLHLRRRVQHEPARSGG
jgi:hypothetical protein